MATLLWIIAVILVISGIYVILARRDLLWGIVLIVLGFLVGPGGVSSFNVQVPRTRGHASAENRYPPFTRSGTRNAGSRPRLGPPPDPPSKTHWAAWPASASLRPAAPGRTPDI